MFGLFISHMFLRVFVNITYKLNNWRLFGTSSLGFVLFRPFASFFDSVSLFHLELL